MKHAEKGKHMRLFVLSVLAIAAGAVPVVAADGVSGKWQVHQSIAGNEADFACTFTQTGDDLAGSCEGLQGTMKLAGKVAEKKVSWTINTEYNGGPLTLKYSGTLESAEKMSGTVSVDPYGVEGDFTATPAK